MEFSTFPDIGAGNTAAQMADASQFLSRRYKKLQEKQIFERSPFVGGNKPGLGGSNSSFPEINAKVRAQQKAVGPATVPAAAPGAAPNVPATPATPSGEPVRTKLRSITELKPEKETSGSFNVTRLNASQWKQMHPTLKAKYLSYTVPPQQIQTQTSLCMKRAKTVIKQRKDTLETLVKEMEELLLKRKGEYTNDEDEKEVEVAMKQARQRMRMRVKTNMQIRVQLFILFSSIYLGRMRNSKC